MLFGARDNKEELLYGQFLQEFFGLNSKNQLYLACSRDIEEDPDTENITLFKGYVQDMIKDQGFCVGENLQKAYQDKITTKMLLCGNKSALGKETFDALCASKVFNQDDEIQN